MAGSLAHHINNIMANIVASTEVAQMLSDDAADLAAPFSDILAQSARASALASSFLAAAGASGELPVPTDLAALIRKVTQDSAESLPEPVALSVVVSDALPLLEIAPMRLASSFRALLDNAAEAVSGNARASITVAIGGLEHLPTKHTLFGIACQTLTDGATVIAVTDNGSGMTEETVARAIEPFFSTYRLGRGLGLAVAYGTMLEHQGGIAIASRVGEGSTVALIFPHRLAESSLVSPLELSNQ